MRAHRLGHYLLAHDRSHETKQADGTVETELEGIPDAPQHNQVQLIRRPTIDQDRAHVDIGKVRDTDQQRRDTPLQPSPGSRSCEQAVARHVLLEEVMGMDAEHPDRSEHDRALS